MLITALPVKLVDVSDLTLTNGVQAGADLLRVVIPGRYLIMASLTLKHDTSDPTSVVVVELRLNQRPTEFKAGATLNAGSADVNSLSLFGVLRCYVGDILELYCYADTEQTITVAACQFGVLA